MERIRKLWHPFLALIFASLAGLSVTACSTDLPGTVAETRYTSSASTFIKLSDGVRLHVRDEGKRDGPVLILAHGSNASLHTWEPWVAALKADWRVISFDFPGHGLTGPSKSRVYNGASYVRVVDELAQHFGVSRFVLAGNSMGGGVALCFGPPREAFWAYFGGCSGLSKTGGERTACVSHRARTDLGGSLFGFHHQGHDRIQFKASHGR